MHWYDQPYRVKILYGTRIDLLAVFMLSPTKGWLELHDLSCHKTQTKILSLVARKVDAHQLWWYPKPENCIYNNRKKFLGQKLK